jgi:hypothetical protein
MSFVLAAGVGAVDVAIIWTIVLSRPSVNPEFSIFWRLI